MSPLLSADAPVEPYLAVSGLQISLEGRVSVTPCPSLLMVVRASIVLDSAGLLSFPLAAPGLHVQVGHVSSQIYS